MAKQLSRSQLKTNKMAKIKKSEETKNLLAQLVGKYNRMVEERKRIEESMKQSMLEIAHHQGKYDAYRDMENEPPAKLIPIKAKVKHINTKEDTKDGETKE